MTDNEISAEIEAAHHWADEIGQDVYVCRTPEGELDQFLQSALTSEHSVIELIRPSRYK